MKERNRYQRAIDTAYLCICLLLAFSLAFGVIFFPRQIFSHEENRALSAPPSLSFSSVLDGSFASSLSSFFSDHIPFRSSFISLKTRLELLLGKQQNNGVIFFPNGNLVSKCDYDSLDVLSSSLDALASVSIHPSVCVALIPRSIDVYERFEASERVLSAAVSSIPNTNCIFQALSSLVSSGVTPYYKTDHHLSADGVFALYSLLSDHLGYFPLAASDFERVCVSDCFLGSTYSKAGLLASSADRIELFRYEGDEELSIRCDDAHCGICAIYDFSCLESKDKYRVFLGGNHGLIQIKNKKEALPSLLVIKDSFANALVPLLARHFSLTVIDPRYYSKPSPSLDEFDKVLILCGLDTIATTRSFERFIQKLPSPKV